MSESTIGVALIGCGIVGGGVAQIIADHQALLQQRTGLAFEIRHVVVRDVSKPRPIKSVAATTDWKAAIDDPRVSIVVELIGGTTTAADIVAYALKLGKHVVTANKSMLAARGADLFGLARKHNACIAFEASCGGGIPIIDALCRGLIANRVDALVGIVNGTCNVILTRMTKNAWSYGEALAEAQKLGFAEADPTLDVSGRDAAQKLALLGSLAFDLRVSESDIHVEGIDTLQTTDIKLAGELGYVIKLLAIAERVGDRVALRVHPTLVNHSDVLAEVGGSFNAISVYGSAVGHTLFYGRGAGAMPTASAVVADLVNVALGSTPLHFKQLRIFPDTTPAASVVPVSDLRSRYYLRLTTRDVPGVMAAVTAVLGRHSISLASISQRESNEGELVPVVITTHVAREGSIRQALQEIDALENIQPATVCLRIIDQPKEFAGN
ncbi:MAG TPA: homoserine dehydrogenase [Tepidisphaeraceae bacterium]|jgi:homoserine dehydrogenase|nr:homoserine dehydrogenase [Tepidisphaeraceae bacterium]